jgi:hypothetical protein
LIDELLIPICPTLFGHNDLASGGGPTQRDPGIDEFADRW